MRDGPARGSSSPSVWQSPWQPWYGILRVAGFDKGGIWSVHKTLETQGSEYSLIEFKWSTLLKCEWTELGGIDQVGD